MLHSSERIFFQTFTLQFTYSLLSNRKLKWKKIEKNSSNGRSHSQTFWRPFYEPLYKNLIIFVVPFGNLITKITITLQLGIKWLWLYSVLFEWNLTARFLQFLRNKVAFKVDFSFLILISRTKKVGWWMKILENDYVF